MRSGLAHESDNLVGGPVRRLSAGDALRSPKQCIDRCVPVLSFRAPVSCGLQEGFDPLSHVQAVFKAIPDDQLVEEHGAQDKTLSVRFPLGGDLSVSLKHALELFVPILDDEGAQFVKHASDLASRIVDALFAIPTGADQDTPSLQTEGLQVRSLIVVVPQHESHFGRQRSGQVQRLLAIRGVGFGQASGQRNPAGADNASDMEFPTIPPAMPA